MTPAARFARILRNPSLYPGVAAALGPGFPWHTHAAGPRSSQALCLSAWAPLAGLEVRHEVIERLLAACLPAAALAVAQAGAAAQAVAGAGPGAAEPEAAADGAAPGDGPASGDGLPSGGWLPSGGRRWRVTLEVSDPDVLGERGGHASAVDVVLESRDAVVCVESKFLRDALAGFRGCGQFPRACRGFHGPGSDRAGGTSAPCRLAVRDCRREARRYWHVAAGLFRPEALAPGPGDPGSCPLHRHYQLARTLLYAKALAARPAPESRAAAGQATGRRYAALVITPAATAGLLERQTAAFAAGVLLPDHAGRVAVAHYEGLVGLLRSCGDPEARAAGDFLAGLLPPAPAPSPVRTVTVRELRRRAAAGRPRRPTASPPAQDAGGEPRTMTS